MIEVRRTKEFGEWLRGLRDQRARARVVKRLERLGDGNPGDVEPVGDGISEMRIHYGPGYRVYYTLRGFALVLWGGNKSTQDRDIAEAKRLASEYEE
jgi:putative addiction module killer protein